MRVPHNPHNVCVSHVLSCIFLREIIEKNVATTTNQAKKQHILRSVGTLAILSYIVVKQHIQKQQLWMDTKGDRPNIAQNILTLLWILHVYLKLPCCFCCSLLFFFFCFSPLNFVRWECVSELATLLSVQYRMNFILIASMYFFSSSTSF